ncbi:hypothetical protein ACJW31_08G181300 [Castanea mollissima]
MAAKTHADIAPFKDEEVLIYDSVVLRRSDLALLEGPFYLNDRILEFFFSYLSLLHPSELIHFVTPSISFWLTNSKDFESLKAFVEPLKPFKVVIFTVNNNDDMSKTDGGTHWSLLVYYKDANTFVHYDSIRCLNGRYAMKLYEAVKGHRRFAMAAMYPCFREYSTPQQNNYYDCGLYVMAIARVICCWCVNTLKKNDEFLFPDILKNVDNSLESTMRIELLNIIKYLRT